MPEVGPGEIRLPEDLEDQKKLTNPGTIASRFLKISFWGFLFIFAFGLVFFPRTSLRRDLNRIHGEWLPEAEVERLVFETIDPLELREWSKNYTREEHLAGGGKDLAEWTNDFFNSQGLESEIVPYYIYLNRPVDNGLTLLKKDGSVKFKASLKEDVLEEDPTTGNKDSVPVFHGYSASGNVTAQYVYANYGRHEDFLRLKELGVDVTGKIVIVRYGGVFRGLKVKEAEKAGAVGVVIFSDPTDDGGIDTQHGYEPYPKGIARNPSSVQRGSVQFLADAPGDPTTPGYPSLIDADRQEPTNLAKIPSLPISFADAVPILKALNGHGPGPKDFDENWGGILEGVSYNVGPSELELNLFNDQDYSIKPIYNVIAKFQGVIPGEAIVVGNHRDAWISGGASDPNSGSAVLLSFAKALGTLKAKGWRPRRTIILGSWDGEEYGLLGSTEWGEDNAEFIKKDVLAYLNLDVAVSGSQFGVEASPVLNELARNTSRRIQHPKGGSLYKHWAGGKEEPHISTLGTGSDYTVFLDHLGVPSIDFGFTNSRNDAVYHYHSNYDSFHWIDTLIDPDWTIHATAAKFLSLLALSLSERAVAELHFEEYGQVLKRGLDTLLDKYPLSSLPSLDKNPLGPESAIDRLYTAISAFTDAGRELDRYTEQLGDAFTRDWPWYKLHKKISLLFKIHVVNRKIKYIERNFIYEDGFDGRPWYKHVLFLPDRYLGYGGAVLPGVLENLQDKKPENLIKWVNITVRLLEKATEQLKA